MLKEMKGERGAMTKTRAGPRSMTPQVIADAALEILRSEGPDALSLRRVAEKLGTNHVAVFRRCGNFDGLLDLCADHVAAALPVFPDAPDWKFVTQLRFEAVYDMWADYADLIVLMRGRAWNGINMMSRFYEPTMRGIVGSGMVISEAATLFSICLLYTSPSPRDS